MPVNSDSTTKMSSLLLCGAMELCWLLCWCLYLVAAITKDSFTLATGLVAYLLPLLLSASLLSKGIRVFWLLLLQILFCGAITLGLLYLNKQLHAPASSSDWLQLILMLVLSLLICYRGAKLPLKNLNYKTLCGLFDCGLFWLMLLGLIKLWMAYKENQVVETDSLPLYLGFFILGAINLASAHLAPARKQTEGEKSGSSLLLVVPVAVIAAFLFLGQYLYSRLGQASRSSLDLISASGNFMLELIAPLFRAIFSYSPRGSPHCRKVAVAVPAIAIWSSR